MSGGELHLLVTIGGCRAALPGAAVQAVVEIDRIVPVPLAPPHVAGLASLRSRALTVIDTRAALGLAPAGDADERGGDGRAAVVRLGAHDYALLVDRVEDVAPAESDPLVLDTTLGPAWDRVARGCIETAQGPAVLLDAAALIEGETGQSRSGLQGEVNPSTIGRTAKPTGD